MQNSCPVWLDVASRGRQSLEGYASDTALQDELRDKLKINFSSPQNLRRQGNLGVYPFQILNYEDHEAHEVEIR